MESFAPYGKLSAAVVPRRAADKPVLTMPPSGSVADLAALAEHDSSVATSAPGLSVALVGGLQRLVEPDDSFAQASGGNSGNSGSWGNGASYYRDSVQDSGASAGPRTPMRGTAASDAQFAFTRGDDTGEGPVAGGPGVAPDGSRRPYAMSSGSAASGMGFRGSQVGPSGGGGSTGGAFAPPGGQTRYWMPDDKCKVSV